MKNKALKLSLGTVAAVALTMVAVACDNPDGKGGDNTTPKTYAVIYDLNGGTGVAPTQKAMAKDAVFTLATDDDFSYEGYVFDGWHDGVAKYDVGATYTMPDKAVTFTAQWKLESEDGQTYTITYDLNGGTGTLPTEADKEAGATFTLNDGKGLAKLYYTFDGWHDGTTKYAAGATYTMPEQNVTLTAQWALEPGVDLPDEIVEYTGDCTLPKKDGYLGEKGGEHIVGIAIDGENEELYYKLSGGTGWIKSKTKYNEITDKQYMPDKYGADAHYYEGKIGELNYYALLKPDFSELTLCDSDDNIIDGAVFTMAIPAPLNVTVTFDLGYAGFGVDNPAPQTFANGGKATLPEIADRTGYTFGGWHVGAADGAAFDFDTPVTSDLTLVAKWVADATSYAITFTAPDDATGTAPTMITVDADTQYTLPANTFTKTGWSFYRWKNTTSGTYAAVGAKYKTTKDVEYVAVFQKQYTVTGDEDYTSFNMLDDGKVVLDGYTYDYTITNGLLTVPDLQLKYKLDETTNNAVAADYISQYTSYIPIKANDGSTLLSFDGFGTVTLGNHTGTYQYNASTFAVTNIAFTDATANTLAVEYSMYQYSANGVVTFENGDTYTFGTVTPTPGPEDPPPSDDKKLYDFAAEGAGNAVKYGYASVDAAIAASQAIVVDHKNLADTTHTFFKATVYYTTAGKLLVYLYRAAPTESDPNKTANIGGAKIDGQDITDSTIANQPIVISNTNYDEFNISFCMVDGKRTMTIKCGDVTVNWTEMTA